MGSVQSPSLRRLVAAKFKWVTFSFFVGFGLLACAGDEAVEEPVAAEEGGEASADGEAVASDDVAAGDESAAGDEMAADDQMEEPEAPSAEEGLEGDMADTAMGEDSEMSAPPEFVDPATEAVNAELADDGLTADGLEPEPSLASLPDAEPAKDDMAGLFPAPSAVTTPSMQSIPVGQVSSPGAAANLPNVAASSSYASDSYAGSSSEQATYVVQSGDTLALIASRIYGHFSNWQQLASANNLGDPYTIFPGDELRYPLSSDQAKTFAAEAEKSRKTIVVRDGDTLSTLAEQVFGSAHSWKVFLSYNKDKISNPHRIHEGLRLAYLDVGHRYQAKSRAKKKATIVNKPKVEPMMPTSAPAESESLPEAIPEEPVADEAVSEEVPAAIEEPAVDETVGEDLPAEEMLGDDEPVEEEMDLGE